MSQPNFPHVSRARAAIESAIARHVGARRWSGARIGRLVGGGVRVVSIGSVRGTFDPNVALAEVRLGSQAIVVAASGGLRAIAQKILGGVDELAAPRPATIAEHAVWSMLLAALLADAGASGDVWPLSEAARGIHDHAREDDRRIGIEIVLEVAGTPLTVIAWCPAEIVMQAPAAREVPKWTFALPIVVARCWLDRAAIAALAVRDVIVVEPALTLIVGDGGFPLTAAPGAVEARVATGYVRDVTTDDAGLPLTVQLGTTRLSLRKLGELAVGEVIGLERPLAGPYEICAGGRVIGQGELVDLDGEIGVRIVSLTQE